MKNLKNKTEQHETLVHTREHMHEFLHFPDGFLWGTATSAHQMEGENRKNDWWQWEQRNAKALHKDVSGIACDMYHRYASDFALAESMHMNAHRLSIEWSRIEPADGVWDEQEIAHYRDVLLSAHAHHQQCFVTLFHFTLPAWFVKNGGWFAKDAVKKFNRFVNKISVSLGDQVNYWITMNEPIIYAVLGYGIQKWPPGERSFVKAIRVFRILAEAHAVSYQTIHETARMFGRPAKVGVAHHNISLSSTRRHSFTESMILLCGDLLWNHEFFRETKGLHDFLGLNYYIHHRIDAPFSSVKNTLADIRGARLDMSDVGWEVYPPGIFDALQDLKGSRIPIFITENGLATTNDDRRIRFIVGYLKELYHAIQSGIPVAGYFYWSLLDGFEWEFGYDAKFGLVSVDRETMERTSKKSFSVYGDIAKNNAISHEVMKYLGHGV